MKNKTVLLLAVAVLVSIGCARVSVQGTEKPIKVDISMRLDVYQHIEKDVDSIENIVSGGKDKQSFLTYIMPNAYAQEGLAPEVEQAALRRKDRREALLSWQQKGVVGEDKSGLVEVRNTVNADESVAPFLDAENADRMIIYKAIAQKNGSSVEEVQIIYAKRLQVDAPSGTPIEVVNGASGAFEWKIK